MTGLARLKEVLWVVATAGAVAILARLVGGLGSSTNLSDAMPWGMWKILNMVAGVAVATGGFALAATVYVFKLERFRPVLKPAVVIAFLGYGASCFALVMDIGLPHAFYKPVIFWNPHSFLFEVAWCVMLYFSVTTLEVAPTILEQHKLHKWSKLVHRVTFPLVLLGITLSSLHHTSLGSLFLAMPTRLHPLWFTPWLPWLFILSAVGSGVFLVVGVTLAYSRLYRRPVDLAMLGSLGRAGAVILGLYLAGKILDLVLRGQVVTLASGQWEVGFFLAELALGALIPIALMLLPGTRKSPVGLATAAASAVAGVILNRLDVGITGLLRSAHMSYFPSLAEFALSLGVFAAAGLAFLFLVENYRIFENTPAREHLAELAAQRQGREAAGRPRALGPIAGYARVSLIVVLAAALAFGAFSARALEGASLVRSPVQAPRGVDTARTVLAINGDRDEDVVFFNHATHQERGGGPASCPKCHHQSLPHDQASPCYKCHADMALRTSIFDHRSHVAHLDDKWSCDKCHSGVGAKNASNAKPCEDCHREDMHLDWGHVERYDYHARSYADAMHGLCVKCHQEQDKMRGTHQAECAFCHTQRRFPPNPNATASPPLPTGGVQP
jgi:Ni/Fe-hydrogenase subunit HybB-like protein